MIRGMNEPGKPPDQRAARKAYGDKVIDEMIAHLTLNQRCWKCNEHHGLVCVCSRAEKAAAYAALDRPIITPATYRG
ncbi:hypothetical protein LCGC14_0879550 [marine sediment metagenome]|uniref:Uncharacterized protein n=1 Tax=marine sediment metagenome TaxID=412755 RepID=A0A0F9S9C2_9ZZZZ